MDKRDLKIIFMGTPEFAAYCLKELYEANYDIVGVISAPDKPAGRGKKIKESEVKKVARSYNLKILQPTNLKDKQFIKELKNLNANLQIVVAFRMLPEVVWSMPEYGTFNLHASLLPQYRGAAPINHAIINGEKTTGVTTFFIEKEIDTGEIIMQKEVEILPNEDAGQLHDKLKVTGSQLILQTIESIKNNTVREISQKKLIEEGDILKKAPKIYKDDCMINWNQNTDDVFNFIRGLSPYPGAWTEINDKTGNSSVLKIFQSEKEIFSHDHTPGTIETDNKTIIKIYTNNGYLQPTNLQLQGKKRMNVQEFLNGFNMLKYGKKI